MLRPRHYQSRVWLLCGAAFLAGILFSQAFFPRTRDKTDGEQADPVDFYETETGHRKSGKPVATVPRKRLLAIVGVQTGFNRIGAPNAYNYRLRRDALRQTWFPKSQAAADALERETGIQLRFVVGHSDNHVQEEEMNREIMENGAFFRLPVQEAYLSLTKKTLVFLQQVTAQYSADYIVKVDDDVYLRVDRLPNVITQWKAGKAGLAHHSPSGTCNQQDWQLFVPSQEDYIGCMKTGGIMRDPNMRWYEPQHELIGGKTYFTHAWGSIYVLSDHAARSLAKVSALVPEGLRFFNNEDVTVGGWMLAMNVTHLDDRRMCEEACGPATVAVYDIPACAGLCDAPKSLPLLHASPECRTPAVDPLKGELPTLQPYFWFTNRPQS